ncbi:MAG TPA: Xaa-Pro peptidase family protein [Opitutaceae bacterium]|jgi:Xaa-Pro aminopeptidase
MAPKKARNVLIYSATDKSADALYFGGVEVPDPFLAFSVGGRRYAVVSELEFGRLKRTSRFDKVIPLEASQARARELWPRQKPGAARVMAAVARGLGARRFTVPADFPAGLYAELRDLRVSLEIAEGALFPGRETKTPAEAAAVREGNRCSAAGIAAAEGVLRASRVRGNRIIHQGRPLTSERLKMAIETACIEAGGVSLSTICAGGDQACDPHCRGSGPLRPHELIVVDVFPRVSATGFHGDMTRTFLKGRANDAQRRIVAAVRAAQKAALRAVRTGALGSDVHAAANGVFTALGFETRRTPRGSVGFFHGTGHGLGLDIHEPPRLSPAAPQPLKRGAVVTVEPGLYYPGTGGCRIEDVVQVTDGAPRMLSRYPYGWEIR